MPFCSYVLIQKETAPQWCLQGVYSFQHLYAGATGTRKLTQGYPDAVREDLIPWFLEVIS